MRRPIGRRAQDEVGSRYVEAWWVNDAGQIVGRADIHGAGNYHRAFLRLNRAVRNFLPENVSLSLD